MNRGQYPFMEENKSIWKTFSITFKPPTNEKL